jgi:hypothetical protein
MAASSITGSAPGRDLPAGRRALLAAGLALPDSRRARTGNRGPETPTVAEGLEGTVQFLTDLCHVQSAQPPAKWAASAPSWSSATTAIPPGTTEGCAPATRPATWKSWKEPHPRHRQPGARLHRRHREPTARIRQGRPLRASPARASSCACARAGPLPHRLAAGQGPRRRTLTKVMIPEALDYPA